MLPDPCCQTQKREPSEVKVTQNGRFMPFFVYSLWHRSKISQILQPHSLTIELVQLLTLQNLVVLQF